MRRALASAASVVLLCACGVREQDQARQVDDAEVPFGLLEPDEPTATTAAPQGEVVTVYLVRDDVLEPVQRTAPDGEVATVLRQLTAETLDAEASQGLQSLLSREGGLDLIQDAELSGGRATIDLHESFAELDAADQRLAIAQVVLTLTGRPGVGQVSFTLDGSFIDVPRGDGSTTGDPLTRGDYAQLVAEAGT